ncbi:MAG: site-2 protease family protein [Methanobacterium sp.]|nr:site-2 protease family protein [Methanobacterium sp.]
MIRFTSREVMDIVISMSVIALIFAYLFSGRNLSSPEFFYLIPVTFIAVGLGFVLHELAHKFMAIRYGFYAEYRLWVEGLILAVITAAFGFVFAAPGAVYIHGEYISKEQNGKISLAGPATNIILAGVFFMLIYYFPSTPLVVVLGVLGFTVNSFLALFNLIPFSILDGAKVFRWNPLIWVAVTAVAGLMVFYSFTGLYF